MSVVVRRGSPKDQIQGFVTSLNSTRCQRSNSYEKKFQGYVEVLQDQERQLPAVEYMDSSGCINLSLSNLCRAVSCCFYSRCCGREVTNYYIADSTSEGVTLRSRVSSTVPTEEENQLTNASFFLDLYRQHGEYLPFLLASAIEYLPTVELKRYWRDWDPESIEHLDRLKAKLFRDLLNQAHSVMNEVRIEMMKKEMHKKLSHSLQTVESASDKQSGEGSSKRNRSPELLAIRSSDIAEFSNLRLFDLENDSGPEIQRGPIARVLSPRIQGVDVERDPSPEIQIAPAQPSSAKYVKVGERLIEFNQEKIIEDLLSFSSCNRVEAKELAIEVEKLISNPCTREEIWSAMKMLVDSRKIQVKPVYNTVFSDEILDIMERTKALKVTDIPYEEFAFIMRVKKNKRSAPRENFRRVPAVVLEKPKEEVQAVKLEGQNVKGMQLSQSFVVDV